MKFNRSPEAASTPCDGAVRFCRAGAVALFLALAGAEGRASMNSSSAEVVDQLRGSEQFQGLIHVMQEKQKAVSEGRLKHPMAGAGPAPAGDQAVTGAVSPPEPQAAAGAASPGGAPQGAVTDAAHAENAPEVAPPKERYVPPRSLMLSPKEEEWIRKAVKSYETKIPVSVMLPDLFPSDAYASADLQAIPPPEPITEPSDAPDEVPVAPPPAANLLPEPVAPENLTFRSFVHIEDGKWLAWLNEDKITSSTKYEKNNIQAKKMEDRRLFFVWTEKQLDRLTPGWDKQLARIGMTDFYTNGKNIIVDRKGGRVGFFLAPGETFSGMDLAVFLGKDAPQREGAVPAGAAAASAAAAGAGASPSAAVAEGAANASDSENGEGVLYASAEAKQPGGKADSAGGGNKDLPAYLTRQNRKYLISLYRLLVN